MRDKPGRTVRVNNRTVYVEESGQGPDWIVFEAGAGGGRTTWDPVLPLLSDRARLVAYDRAGQGRSGRIPGQLSIDDMAADLVALTESVVPGNFLLVAHSMGGLIARRAAERLAPRLKGLLLVDPTPETAPVYDNWDESVRKADRMLAVSQTLVAFRPLARLLTTNIRRLYPADTYQAMLAEDFVPAGIAETRKHLQAANAAVKQFRADPPQLPTCPAILLSATRAPKGKEARYADMRAHQRAYVESIPGGEWEPVESGHFIPAEQPQLVADKALKLLSL